MLLWFIKELELLEIIDIIKEELDFDDYDMEYENLWQWVESNDRNHTNYFDLSREHTSGKSDLDMPCILRLMNKGILCDKEEVLRVGMIISNKLKVEVNCGSLLRKPNSIYDTNIEFVFNSN